MHTSLLHMLAAPLTEGNSDAAPSLSNGEAVFADILSAQTGAHTDAPASLARSAGGEKLIVSAPPSADPESTPPTVASKDAGPSAKALTPAEGDVIAAGSKADAQDALGAAAQPPVEGKSAKAEPSMPQTDATNADTIKEATAKKASATGNGASPDAPQPPSASATSSPSTATAAPAPASQETASQQAAASSPPNPSPSKSSNPSAHATPLPNHAEANATPKAKPSPPSQTPSGSPAASSDKAAPTPPSAAKPSPPAPSAPSAKSFAETAGASTPTATETPAKNTPASASRPEVEAGQPAKVQSAPPSSSAKEGSPRSVAATSSTGSPSDSAAQASSQKTTPAPPPPPQPSAGRVQDKPRPASPQAIETAETNASKATMSTEKAEQATRQGVASPSTSNASKTSSSTHERSAAPHSAKTVEVRTPAGGEATSDGGTSDSGDDQPSRQRAQAAQNAHARQKKASPHQSTTFSLNANSASGASAGRGSGESTGFTPAPARPDGETSPEILGRAATEGSTTTDSTRSSSSSHRPAPFTSPHRSMAWLRAKMGRPSFAQAASGWKMIEMQLQEGDGTVTLKTRQDNERMAVSVGFSDARLRSIASAQAQQLQDALQAQYDTEIDFSLMSDGSDSSQDQAPDEGPSSASLASPDRLDPDATADNTVPRTSLTGGQHEWIG